MAPGPNNENRTFRGLIVDWGGVLTAPLTDTMASWAQQENIDVEVFHDVMRAWLGSPASAVHDLERGRIAPEEFEIALAAELRTRGAEVASDGLLSRFLSGLAELHDDMLGLVRRARRAGVRTALLSNSWGEHYPESQWAGAFDAVVISGRVGMRKPDPEIFIHTARLLRLEPAECVMVDDLPRNIEGAVAVGMAGVLHRTYDETATELDILLDLPSS